MTPSVPEMLLRIALAFVAGFLIGWERECHGRPAGLRTNILACVASAVAMIVSETLLGRAVAMGASGAIRADPSRLGAGILTGIGFLGGGTILRHEDLVRGVTTAASLWFVAILGLAFGTGEYALGFIGVGVALITLLLLPLFEKGVPSDSYAKVTVTAALDTLFEEELRTRVESQGPRVLAMKMSYDLGARQKTMTCELRLGRQEALTLPGKIVADLARRPGVVKVEWS